MTSDIQRTSMLNSTFKSYVSADPVLIERFPLPKHHLQLVGNHTELTRIPASDKKTNFMSYRMNTML
jgi:hypothetical protein